MLRNEASSATPLHDQHHARFEGGGFDASAMGSPFLDLKAPRKSQTKRRAIYMCIYIYISIHAKPLTVQT